MSLIVSSILLESEQNCEGFFRQKLRKQFGLVLSRMMGFKTFLSISKKIFQEFWFQKNEYKNDFRMLMKKYAADSEIGFPTKSILKSFGRS